MSEDPAAIQRLLLDDLRRQILTGVLAAGEKLPSVRALAARHHLDKNRVDQVITELANTGLVESRQGAGTWVREFKAIPRSSPRRLSKERRDLGIAIQDSDTGGRWRTVGIRTGEEPAPDWAAAALDIAPGTPVAFRDRRFLVDDRAVQLSRSYLPTEIARGTQIMHSDTGPDGTYGRLRDLGHEPIRFTEFLRARMPLPDEAERLNLPRGTPVIEITRHAFEESGRCVEVNRMILDGMAYLLDYSFPA